MADSVVPRARSLLAALSPRRRRWLRFLRSLPLDPTRAGECFAEPGPRDVILCGCPRTGTTLLAAALWQPPAMVTAMEPWDGMRIPPAHLFTSLREEVDERHELKRTRLDVSALLQRGETSWCAEGRPNPVRLDGTYLLGVKWPNYWQFLDKLRNARFIVTIRSPYETIASFKARGGRVGEGLQYNTRFNEELNASLLRATQERALRRVLLYDYVHSRILPHIGRANVHVVRYEDWTAEADSVLNGISRFLMTDLNRTHVQIRNSSSLGALDQRDVELIATHCRTAEALGYSLKPPDR